MDFPVTQANKSPSFLYPVWVILPSTVGKPCPTQEGWRMCRGQLGRPPWREQPQGARRRGTAGRGGLVPHLGLSHWRGLGRARCGWLRALTRPLQLQQGGVVCRCRREAGGLLRGHPTAQAREEWGWPQTEFPRDLQSWWRGGGG